MREEDARPSPGLSTTAEEYFRVLGEALPVCCLSDEFHFMPRAEAARLHLGSADRLERDAVEGLCEKVREWKGRSAGSEDPLRAGLLQGSMEAFLLNWESLRVLERDPSLYLKVGLIGLDLALGWPGGEGESREELYRARLGAIPRLVETAEAQLREVPGPALEAGLEMVGACGDFLERVAAERAAGQADSRRDRYAEEGAALQALARFRAFLLELRPAERLTLEEDRLEEILVKGYGWEGGARAAREVLRASEAEATSALEALAAKIDPGREWRAIYAGIRLPERMVPGILYLYQEEVERLEGFFRARDLLPMPPAGSVRVEPTPPYLHPVRATASYSAPPFLGGSVRSGLFYVHVEDPAELAEGAGSRVEAAHREFRYLTAHETFPGHHMLDWCRLHLDDPIRRQVESALFYEGWACYAEQLLDESGYETDPTQHLIRLKRELWRAVRGRLDLDLHTGAVSPERGAQRLQALGYGAAEARKAVRRYSLTPGYQLCYTLGRRRLLDLRERFSPPLSLKAFHSIVLSSGQLPFEHLEAALRSAAGRGDG